MAGSKTKKLDEFTAHLQSLVSDYFHVDNISLEKAVASYTEFKWVTPEEPHEQCSIRIFHGSKKASRKDIENYVKKFTADNVKHAYIASLLGFSKTVQEYLDSNDFPLEVIELDIDPKKMKEKTKKKKSSLKGKDLQAMKALAERLINEHKPPEVITTQEQAPDVIDVIGKIEEIPIAIIRLIGKESVGVREIRDFQKLLDSKSTPVRLAAIIALDRFSPSAVKEAQELEIDLISLKDESEAEMRGALKLNARLITGAKQILRRMGYEPISSDDPLYQELGKGVSSLGAYLAGRDKKRKERMILVLIPKEDIVKVHTMREFKTLLDHQDIPRGMVIAREKFTYTAVREADERIQIIEDNHPVFDIFRHELVPLHELVPIEEEKELLQQLGVKAYQLPKIKMSDPAVKVLNGKPGRIVKIIRSEDAVSYRIIVS